MSVWDALVGQEHAVEVLAATIADPSRMTHAWLITGPPGSGRSVAARAFAAALQCELGTGCGECKSCRTVVMGTHPDVDFVSTEHVSFKKDEMRALILTAARSASQGKWRIIVIEDADRMREDSANVLLKAIEEPAEKTVWLLCAPSPEDAIVTIRSRCRHLGLRIPDPQAVAELLVARDGVDPHVALSAARAAQSHIGIAKRLATDPEARARRARLLELPERIRGVGDAVLEAGVLVEEAAADAKAVGAHLDDEERTALLRTFGLTEEDKIPPALRSQLRALEEDQKRRAKRVQIDALDRAMTDLLSFYRDVISVQLGADIHLINSDMSAHVEAVAAQSTAEQTLRRMDAIGQTRMRLAANVAPLLAVEAMLIALRPQG